MTSPLTANYSGALELRFSVGKNLWKMVASSNAMMDTSIAKLAIGNTQRQRQVLINLYQLINRHVPFCTNPSLSQNGMPFYLFGQIAWDSSRSRIRA
jgi:hypothetical protein